VGTDDYRTVDRAGVVGHEMLAKAAREGEKPPEPEGPSDFATEEIARRPAVKSGRGETTAASATPPRSGTRAPSSTTVRGHSLAS
jgi:hypothetical protein